MTSLSERLAGLGWVSDLWVAGSLATGDHVAGVSDVDPEALHPTWTHGRLVRRTFSGVTRAELVRHGFAGHGRPPTELLPAMTDGEVRDAARAELCGYWAWAARRPWLWLDRQLADLGLTAMARGRHTMRTGLLLSKTEAVEQAHAPAWLITELAARRQGERVASPRLRTAWIAWRDAVRTVSAARRGQ